MLDTPGRTNEIFLSAVHEHATGCVHIRPLGRPQYVFERHAEGLQPDRVNHNLVLLHFAPQGDYLRYSRNREKTSANRPVGHRTHVHRRHGRVPCHRDKHDLAHDGRDRGQCGVPHPYREARRDELELLVYDLTGPKDVGTPVEFHPDNADPLRSGGADPAHPGGAVHRRLDRECDEGLHLLGRHPVGFRKDGYRGGREIREDVHGHADSSNGSGHQKDAGRDQHEEAIVDGPTDHTV